MRSRSPRAGSAPRTRDPRRVAARAASARRGGRARCRAPAAPRPCRRSRVATRSRSGPRTAAACRPRRDRRGTRCGRRGASASARQSQGSGGSRSGPDRRSRPGVQRSRAGAAGAQCASISTGYPGRHARNPARAFSECRLRVRPARSPAARVHRPRARAGRSRRPRRRAARRRTPRRRPGRTEERVEARQLGGVVLDLGAEVARRERVAARRRVRLALGVEARVGRRAVHRRGRDQLAVASATKTATGCSAARRSRSARSQVPAPASCALPSGRRPRGANRTLAEPRRSDHQGLAVALNRARQAFRCRSSGVSPARVIRSSGIPTRTS